MLFGLRCVSLLRRLRDLVAGFQLEDLGLIFLPQGHLFVVIRVYSIQDAEAGQITTVSSVCELFGTGYHPDPGLLTRSAGRPLSPITQDR